MDELEKWQNKNGRIKMAEEKWHKKNGRIKNGQEKITK